MKKRVSLFRIPKPGFLIARWGRLPHDKPDLCYGWNAPARACDSRLLDNLLASKPIESYENGCPVFGKSFLEELEERGYDITTLRFEVQMKPAAPKPESV